MTLTRGEKIKKAMELRNISASELAERIGKTKSYVYQILRNDGMNPSLETLKDIARELDISVGYMEEDVEINEDVIYYDEPDILNKLPKDLKDFVVSEENTPYLIIAKQLSAYDLSKIGTTEMNFLIEWLRMAVDKKDNE